MSAASLNDSRRVSEFKLRCPLGGAKYKDEHLEVLGRMVGRSGLPKGHYIIWMFPKIVVPPNHPIEK